MRRRAGRSRSTSASPTKELAEVSIGERIAVPISVLTEEARRNFDLRDESSRAVPVLGRHQNGDLTHIALMNGAVNALPADLTPEAFELLTADLRQVVFAPPAAAADARPCEVRWPDQYAQQRR